MASWSDLTRPAPLAATANLPPDAGLTPDHTATSWLAKREDSRPADRLKSLTGAVGWAYGWPLTTRAATASKAAGPDEQPAPFAA